jgi:HSP20 family protein
MNLVRYNPRHSLSPRPWRGNGFFDNFFDDMLVPFVMNTNRASLQENLGLKVDIYERNNAICIDAEMPGIDKENISIDVKGKLLTLGAERQKDEEVKDEHCFRRERSYGKISRTFNLPFEVDSDKVKATYKNGILKLEISKPEAQAVKKITVN